MITLGTGRTWSSAKLRNSMWLFFTIPILSYSYLNWHAASTSQHLVDDFSTGPQHKGLAVAVVTPVVQGTGRPGMFVSIATAKLSTHRHYTHSALSSAFTWYVVTVVCRLHSLPTPYLLMLAAYSGGGCPLVDTSTQRLCQPKQYWDWDE
jgi:uncharacterized membrane protein